MITTTPIGVLTFWSFKPLGRTLSSRSRPTGSGRAATSRRPFAMTAILFSSSFRRSSIAEARSIFAPSSISRALAALIAGASCSRAPAMASRQAFFASVLSWASWREADLASFASCVICSVSVMRASYGKKTIRTARKMSDARPPRRWGWGIPLGKTTEHPTSDCKAISFRAGKRKFHVFGQKDLAFVIVRTIAIKGGEIVLKPQRKRPNLEKIPGSSGPPPRSGGQSLSRWICCGLAVITFLAFLPVLQNEFVNYDDPDYVTTNSHVLSGLTLENIGWAFRTGFASNWHPLTWISHMLDCGLFAQRASAHHLVSLLFHIANVCVLYLGLVWMTGATWPSAMIAASFALHPCHVESVAWISERKDVLSGFFGLLTVWTYAVYTKARDGEGGTRSRARLCYGLSLFCFALGLMSKPMLVTWPFVLLLLDYWPLKRFGFTAVGSGNAPRILVEKLPFFALSIASSVVTFLVQRKGGAVSTSISLLARIENAVVAYARYISDLFWPHDL